MKSRDRTVLAAVALLVLAVAGYFLTVAPAHHQANRLQTEVASAQTRLTQAEAEVQAGVAAESQYKAYAGQLKSISKAVPTDQQIPELINELQAASDTTKVSFQAVTASSSAATSPTTSGSTSAGIFPSQSVTLQFVGSYAAVSHVLGQMAGFVRADDRHFSATGRLINIGGVTLSQGGSGTAPGASGSGVVTGGVTAVDYDIPTALLAASTATSSSTPATSTASPAAYVTHSR